MKKILFIIEAMSGGAGRHVQDLILNLDAEKYEIYCIYSENRTDSRFIKQKKYLNNQATLIECNRLNREINIINDMSALLEIVKIIKKIKPDIIHCHSSKAGVIGRFAAKICGVKKIYYTPHAYSFLAPEFSEKKKKIFIAIEKYLSRFATTKIFCVSKGELKAALNNKIDKEDKFEVIYNGVPNVELPSKKEVRNKLGLPLDAIIVGNNARMSEQKNVKYFLEIAKEVIKQNDKYHFVWAGDGPLMDKVISYIDTNKLISNVHLIGDRSDSELIVAGYDVFLLTSLYEGLPYAPIEALRAGVSILGTNVIGNNEIISDGINGNFIVEGEDYFTQIEDTLIINSEDVKRTFDNKFSLKKMIALYTEVYKEKDYER